MYPRLKSSAMGFKRGFTPLQLGKQEIETVTCGCPIPCLPQGGLRGPIWTGPLMFFASSYNKVVVFSVPLQGHMLHCKWCCGLVLASYRMTVSERLQLQTFAVLLIS